MQPKKKPFYNLKRIESKRLASKKSKFNNWVGRQYSIIYNREKFTGTFEKKLEPRVKVVLMFLMKDVSLHDKTPKQKKEILFQYFLNILKEKEILAQSEFVEDKKFETEITIKEKARILNNSKRKPKNDCFYLSNRWIDLKLKVRRMYRCGCMKCGKTNTEIHVDHIFPRSLHPELQYNIHNLQILCKDCNLEKSNKDFTDYRTPEQKKLCQIKYN